MFFLCRHRLGLSDHSKLLKKIPAPPDRFDKSKYLLTILEGIKKMRELAKPLCFMILSLMYLVSAVTSACTDAQWDSVREYSSKTEMKCFSGDTLIFHGESTGKIENEANSDGYRARWKIIYLDNNTSVWGDLEPGDILPGGVSGNCLKFSIELKKDKVVK